MIKYLKLKNVGPASTLEFNDMGKRLNLISGDNGLGKSFLLDTVWWALTRKWPAEINPRLTAGKKALPRESGEASIEFKFAGKIKNEEYISTFLREDQAWTGRPGRPANPGLVLYAMADGSFALWDPARNYWTQKGDVDIQERQPAYVFNPNEVWDGLKGENGSILCNGLISDWAGWQKEKGSVYKKFCAVLTALSESEKELLTPGAFQRIGLDDVRDIPSLKMTYGQDVPILHASSGMRRIITLAYFLVWVWEEHLKASRQLDQKPTNQLVFLVDEIESHLHPKWQRRIIPALMEAVKSLSKITDMQIIAATHSPLIMASAEPLFDPLKDAWFDFDLVGKNVKLTRRDFEKQGDVINWLTCEAFDLSSGRALEYEKMIEKASKILDENTKPTSFEQVHDMLVSSLNPVDDFLFRWRYISKQKGWLK
jgi:predicted ATPase